MFFVCIYIYTHVYIHIHIYVMKYVYIDYIFTTKGMLVCIHMHIVCTPYIYIYTLKVICLLNCDMPLARMTCAKKLP